MKKLIACLATAFLLVTFTPIQSAAEKKPATERELAEIKALINRINEINAMDRSTMSRAEKKAIRKELRAIKKEVHRHSSSGLYISWGIVVLILVLIIIF